ncbi:MAG TPA: hypothetical protein ENH45_03785 [Nitrospirae bacterium]|nr:hypothetical protein BMS3Abin09_00735 [bacterium BMS3Abin09]GBE41842.1 hypothetical protein BMS3Bbin09_01750 [bacterium BMS3Bbin09]HDH33968.1 hypothetical protein [Nitrospirota bacterium]HDZ84319.1 hypothetical protein [Nitrospirota bacterium]
MLRNYFLINMVIVIILGFLGFKFYHVVTYSIEMPSEASVKDGLKSKDIDIKFKDKLPDKASFQIISSKDLFRPSRTASVADLRTVPKNGHTNYPKLFATIIRENDSIAIIEDPDTKKTKPYGVNDLVSGFLVSKILEDRVILLLGDEKIEIKLRDDKGIKTFRPRPLLRQKVKQNRRNTPAPVRRRTPVRRPIRGDLTEDTNG